MRSLNEISFRKSYPVFRYNGYSLKNTDEEIKIVYDFSIDGLCEFHPSISVETRGLTVINPFDSEAAAEIIFSMGMVEAVSYFKAVCPEKMIVQCGGLDDSDIKSFKKLWFNGLGEFFYRNGISASENDFITVEAPGRTHSGIYKMKSSGLNIIPVGGGKDSCVTAELLKGCAEKNLFFTVNDQKARTDCIEAAGGSEKNTVRIKRTIAPELLELNAKGFLNGHTPFSAVVAFTSLYTAYLTGAENIILSNESSANEGNTESGVNHQYSKSFDFENDFNKYVSKNISDNIHYFSLLRPFNELQIAKMFSSLGQYHEVFRSCNRGSKKNIWCEECPKCLFVYGLLSAFLTADELKKIFKTDMFSNEKLANDFSGLTGISAVKPFECVGTADEFNYAVAKKLMRDYPDRNNLPPLLKIFDEAFDAKAIAKDDSLLSEWESENLVPERFSGTVKEMYKLVSDN